MASLQCYVRPAWVRDLLIFAMTERLFTSLTKIFDYEIFNPLCFSASGETIQPLLLFPNTPIANTDATQRASCPFPSFRDF